PHAGTDVGGVSRSACRRHAARSISAYRRGRVRGLGARTMKARPLSGRDLPTDTAASSDGARIFLTALLVYAAFVNPTVQNSMTWNYLDAAVSLVDTGRWQVTHAPLYAAQDTAT